jgi:ribosomal protein S18 acetylase RimI-like enzyme
MSVVLRPAQDSDIPAMAVLRAMRWADEASWVVRIRGYISGEHSPQKALAQRAVFVAEDQGSVIGFVAGHLTFRLDCDGELQWIDVAEERRREGIGQTLVRQIGKWFVEHQAVRICVNVDPKNVIARNLYLKCGARALSEQWMVWEDAGKMSANAASSGTRLLY